MGDQYAANDALDQQRMFIAMSGLFSALGQDPGYAPYDAVASGGLYTPVGTHQVLSVSTGQAPQGQPAQTPVVLTLGGYTITMPALIAIAAVAYLVLK